MGKLQERRREKMKDEVGEGVKMEGVGRKEEEGRFPRRGRLIGSELKRRTGSR